MSNKKIIFSISFHWQLDQLKWHLSNIFSWNCSPDCEYVIVSAHKDNLTVINKWVKKNYQDRKVDYLYIEEDHGNHFGCTMNVVEGLKYIRDNKEYTHVANVEADNQFRCEEKFLQLIDKLDESNKHMLLVDHHPCYGDGLFTKYTQARNYFHATTLNIYTKHFIDNHFPLEYNNKHLGWGWCGAPGTPFETYLALSLIDKMELKTDEDVINYMEEYGYKLTYDRNHDPCNYAEPDDLTPDRYMKYGILNCPNARNSLGATEPDIWKKALKFVELHDPLKYEFK